MQVLLGVILSLISIQTSAITIPLKKLPITLDPQSYEDIYSMVVILQIHRGLMKFKSNLEIDTDIAESYKVMDNGKTIRFILRDRKFSDGTKITSQHVLYTMQRLFKQRAGFSADMNYIKGAKDVLSGKKDVDALGISVIDYRTVEFQLEQPVGIFFTHLATVDMAILPLTSNLEYDWEKRIGAGPYVVNSWDKQKLTLKARDVEKHSYPKLVTLVEMNDLNAINGALKGELDSLDGFSVPSNIVKKLEDIGWRQTVTTMTKQLFLVLNPDTMSKEVREIIQSQILQMEFQNLSASYHKAFGIIPVGVVGALKSNGSSKIIGLKSLKKTIKLNIDMVDVEPVIGVLVEQIKEELKKVNIILNVNKVSIEQYLEKIKNKKFDLIVRSKFLDYPDGISILTYFRSQSVANSFFVNSVKVDDLLDKSMSELSIEKRSLLYQEIQKEILAQRTIVPLVFGSDNLGLWSKTVNVVPAHPIGIHGLPFDEIKLKK